MPIDIFPFIDIPVISVVWNYAGHVARGDGEPYSHASSNAGMTTTVNDIEHIESQSYYGVSVIRVYFQPNVKIDMAWRRSAAQSPTPLRATCLRESSRQTSSVRRLQRAHPPIRPGKQNPKRAGNLRPGARTSSALRWQPCKAQPCRPLRRQAAPGGGGSGSECAVCQAVSAIDVSNAFNPQNLIVPAGTVKVATRIRRAPQQQPRDRCSDLNNLPIKTVNGATVYLRDVATVRDGYSVQTNIVRTNGTPRRAAHHSA